VRLAAVAVVIVLLVSLIVTARRVPDAPLYSAGAAPTTDVPPGYERHMRALREADRRVEEAGGDDRYWQAWYEDALAEQR
jgi:hypothetical protein